MMFLFLRRHDLDMSRFLALIMVKMLAIMLSFYQEGYELKLDRVKAQASLSKLRKSLR